LLDGHSKRGETRNVAGPGLWVNARYHNVVVAASKKMYLVKIISGD
jgi:hypothetical protein